MNPVTISESLIGNAMLPSVDARHLHHALGVRRDFSTWIKARIAAYGFVRGTDYIPLPHFGEQCFQGVRDRIDYALTLDMAKELAMVERTEMGRQVRRYFIECERRLVAERVGEAAALRRQMKTLMGRMEERRAVLAPDPRARVRIALLHALATAPTGMTTLTIMRGRVKRFAKTAMILEVAKEMDARGEIVFYRCPAQGGTRTLFSVPE